MKKSVQIIIGVIAIIAIIAAIAIAIIFNGKSLNGKTSLPEVSSLEDLHELIEKIYEPVDIGDLMIDTIDVNLTDANSVKSFTGLEDGNSFEYLCVSEPLIGSIPYSFVIGKVKEGVNANELAKQMSESINQRKWICVTANDLYATSSGEYVFLVMGGQSSAEIAKSAYDSFKNLAQKVGEEYEKSISDEEIPDDTEGTPVFQVPTTEQ